MFHARCLFFVYAVLVGAARAYTPPTQTYHEASWSADATGDLIADPMPDYSALLQHNVSYIGLEIHNTSLCYTGVKHAYIFRHVNTKHGCLERFKWPHTWNNLNQSLSVSDEQVAQEYHMQGDLEHTKGRLYYVAQWDALEMQCAIKLARGCPFSPDVCQDSIRRTDRCLKELRNMHVTQAGDATLFNLQAPCANQFKLPSWYATRDHVADYMSSFYKIAWTTYPQSRPSNVTQKPNKVAQVPPPKYTKRGHGFCDVERAYTNVWSNVSGLYSRGDCPMVIRKTLSLRPYATSVFVGGWPFGGDLPVSWLDGWPLVWAFEATGAQGTCHWLNLQNVTSATVGKLLDETECSSLSSNWKAANITVYQKHLEDGSVEHGRFFSVGTAADHDIQIRCLPGQSAAGSSWTDFVNGAQVCVPCPPYTYKDDGAASGRCKPCPIGLGTDAVGSQSSTVCEMLRNDTYKWDNDADGAEVFAIPIDEPPSAFMNWREERSRVAQLCGNRTGCKFEDVIRESRCALIKEDNALYKETRVLANVQEDIRVQDAANRRLGVFIPQNALVTDTNVSVSVAPEPTLEDDLDLDDDGVLKFAGTRITYQPHGLQFTAAVTLYLHARAELVPYGTVPEVYYLNTSGANAVWEPVPGSVYNASTGEISVQSQHFSSYATVVDTSSVATPSTPSPPPPAETNASSTPAPPPQAPAETNASSTPVPSGGGENTPTTTPEPTKSKGLAPGAIVGITFAGLFLLVACVVYISCIRQPAKAQATQVTDSLTNTRLTGANAYYIPVPYASPYIV